MSCKKFEHWAGLYVEGDLGVRSSRRLEQHISSCSRCRELVQGLEESQVALREWGAEEPRPEAFTEMRRRTRQAVEAEIESSPGRQVSVFTGAWWRFALASGAALLLIGWLFFFIVQTPPGEREQMAEEISAPVEETLPEPEPRTPESETRPRVADQTPPQSVKDVVDEPRMVDVTPNETETTEMTMAEATGDESPAALDLVVKLVTDDPDIVIYWLVERNGG